MVRSVYGSHATNEVFKLAFVGDVWEWHQDFIFWQREDGVEDAQLVTIAVFLDEVTEFNAGPAFSWTGM